MTTTVGRELVVALAAIAPGAPAVNVSISASGLPLRAAFQPVTGNPGTATLTWRPTRTQAGRTFAVTFTAQATAPAVAPATRRVTLHVAKPKPRPGPGPRSFVLSSQKQSSTATPS